MYIHKLLVNNPDESVDDFTAKGSGKFSMICTKSLIATLYYSSESAQSYLNNNVPVPINNIVND